MAFVLPDLPYAKDAFGDILSAETFDYHHGKHHNAYVTKANELVAADASLQGKSLVELIESSKGGLFNQVGQIWNHTFYWHSLSPEKKQPSGELLEKINDAFGSVDALIDKMKAEAVGHFASGWAALILKDGKLEVTSYHDADTPVAHEGHTPLLILDVWEHAYYIDYRNARPNYAERVLKEAINWDFAAQNLDGQGVSRADQPA
ncbi:MULTISPECIES: superoxide dismutase [Sphingobium]|jgi:superoxide dismutase, Fe-Mn family|uniref:superoxide dismutase n=1 Tax=Sphingobium TaxID=165695 RepID=UPI000C670D2A|nr:MULTISPECIES: superoxide dismutase [Sphingobium]MAP45861.1 superoxide dismutase [Fe] [Sphingobium sp.]MAX15363.1 superoxide dismutase [Fe] [Sphingobium sp.]MBS49218.1 superoxide dismutase [Fe] [Sphingobium sp.]MBS49229.1 superoxide dismutase [Fe] [Sphingobium sp.]MCC4257381.1 superoxide dismutase [Sphingobium lactosutens]|tara:strand:- start:1942 stop:2556 length:615 start_codon:yes stop_codon:yes gene_type:complete